MPAPEARILLRDLNEHATQPAFVHVHRWRLNDLIMWDNRCSLHARADFPADERRVLRRVTVLGETPV